MIAEDHIFDHQKPDMDISSHATIDLIKMCMTGTVVHFREYLKLGFHKKKDLNENDLTQEYTKQAQILIRKENYPFNIEGQYQDAYNLSKGFSDFFFYPNEQGVSTASIFSVESKRLPSPDKNREKEYVVGDNDNGGVERYKTEKHGKGLVHCGLLGFVEDKDFNHWQSTINEWILDLSKSDFSVWKIDEVLTTSDSQADYHVLSSVAHRRTDDISLTHLWLYVN